jgi:hypothetical protein
MRKVQYFKNRQIQYEDKENSGPNLNKKDDSSKGKFIF